MLHIMPSIAVTILNTILPAVPAFSANLSIILKINPTVADKRLHENIRCIFENAYLMLSPKVAFPPSNLFFVVYTTQTLKNVAINANPKYVTNMTKNSRAP